jgi:hypothetical protein
VLLQDRNGRRLISHGGATLQQADGATLAALVASLLAGALAAVYWLVVPLLRRWLPGRPGLQPASVSVALLLLAAAGLALQPWQRLGDLTVFSAALAAASATLPLALIWQAVRSWRQRPRLRGWRADLLAAGAGLQAVALLAAYGLWPLQLWRL